MLGIGWKMSLVELIVYGLAVYRASRFIIEDHLPEPIRNAIWRKFPPSHGIGYLITCYWCTSFWVASIIIICSILIPSVVFIICAILALSAIAGIVSQLVDRG